MPQGGWAGATEARRLVDCINMLAVRFTLTFRSRPWALSHRSCESEIKLSAELPTDVEVEDNPCFKSPFAPPPLASFYSNQIVSVAVLAPGLTHLLVHLYLPGPGFLSHCICVCVTNRLFTLSPGWALQIEFELMPLTRPAATSLPSPGWATTHLLIGHASNIIIIRRSSNIIHTFRLGFILAPASSASRCGACSYAWLTYVNSII